MADPMASHVSKFKKGHRRAFSMPGGSNHLYTAVVENGSNKSNSVRKGFIVKYRPHADSIKVEDALKTMLDSVNEFSFPNQMDRDDDDSEMMIKINEEEIVLSSDDLSKKDARIAIRRIWEARWKVTNFEFLPEWLQDNEFLRTGHRPPLPSFGSCFKSIFSLHTETGNIWTHMYGCVAFIGAAIWFMTRPNSLVQVEDKIVFSTFFIGAIACLGLSFAFHTVQCHSVGVGKLFSKLDYTGISLLIVGSFIPWIYYGFYCRMLPMIIYISMISLLGVAAVVVSLWDKFAQPRYRPLRAIIFVAMGLSSIVPAFHILLTDGLSYLLNEASLQWLILMGVLYITGAVFYATRTPERCFPGKCDLWIVNVADRCTEIIGNIGSEAPGSASGNPEKFSFPISIARDYAAHVHLTMKNVHDRVMLVLSLYDKINLKKLTLDSKFEDLGLDSLDHVELIMAIEDEFQFEIPDGDSDQMKTPRDIYQYICDRKDLYE